MSAYGASIARAAIARRVPPPGPSGRITEAGIVPIAGAAALGWLASTAGKVAAFLGLSFGAEALIGFIEDGDAAKSAEPLHWIDAIYLTTRVESMDVVAQSTLTGGARAKWEWAVAASRTLFDDPATTLLDGELSVRQLQAALDILQTEQTGTPTTTPKTPAGPAAPQLAGAGWWPVAALAAGLAALAYWGAR